MIFWIDTTSLSLSTAMLLLALLPTQDWPVLDAMAESHSLARASGKA
jgi:hypothetical protein